MASGIFHCGAECGVNTTTLDLNHHWNTFGADVSIESSITAGAWSARSFKFNPAASTNAQLYKTFGSAIGSPATMVARFRIRFDTLPDAIHTIVSDDAGNLGIRYNPTGTKLEAFCGQAAGSVTFAGSFVPSTGVYYLIDISTTRDTTKTVSWKVDGAAQTTATRGSQSASSTSQIRFGHNTTGTTLHGSVATTATFYIDDIVVSGTGADFPIASGKGVGLWATSDGTHNYTNATDFKKDNSTNVAAAGAETASYAELMQPLGTGQTSSFMSQNAVATGNYLEWVMGDLDADAAAGTINGFAVVSSAGAAGTSADNQKLKIVRAGTETQVYSSDVSFTSNPSAHHNWQAYTTDPNGGAAWDKTAIDAYRVRWGYSSDVNSVPYLFGVMFEVDYTPGNTTTNVDVPTVTQTQTVTVDNIHIETRPVDVPTVTETETPAVTVHLATFHTDVAVTETETPSVAIGLASPLAVFAAQTETPAVAIQRTLHRTLTFTEPQTASVTVVPTTPGNVTAVTVAVTMTQTATVRVKKTKRRNPPLPAPSGTTPILFNLTQIQAVTVSVVANLQSPPAPPPIEQVGDFALERLSFPTLASLGAVVPVAETIKFEEQFDETGNGEFAVMFDLAKPRKGEVVTISIRGVPRWSMIIDGYKNRSVWPTGGEAEHRREYKGAGAMSVWKKARVRPFLALNAQPKQTDMHWDYTHPGYNHFWWVGPVTFTNDELVNDWGTDFGQWADWTDVDPGALGIACPGDTLADAIEGNRFAIQDVEVPAVPGEDFRILFGGDNTFELSIDTSRVINTDQWDNFGHVNEQQVKISPGLRRFAWHWENKPWVTPDNPSASRWTLLDMAGNMIAHSDASCVVVGPVEMGYEDEIPGMTVGNAIRLMLEQMQAHGLLTFMTLGFDDIYDTNGVPWAPIAPSSTPNARLSTSLWTDGLTVLREASATYCDVRQRPLTADGIWVLDAYNKGTMNDVAIATTFLAPDPNAPDDACATALEQDSRLDQANILIGEWNDEYIEVRDEDAIARDGPIEGRIEIGAVNGRDEALRVMREALADYANPREQVTVTVDGAEPYADYDLGNRTFTLDSEGNALEVRVVALAVVSNKVGDAIGTPSVGDLFLDVDA